MALDLGPLPEAQVDTVARTDFNDAMNTIDSSFPLQTIDIGDAQVTPAKVEAGFGRFVPRNCAAIDFSIGAPFAADGNLHANGLDVSGIVPPEAIAVLLLVEFSGAGFFQLFANQTTMIKNSLRIQNSNIELPLILNLDTVAADRLIDYKLSAGSAAGNVTVLGWWV